MGVGVTFGVGVGVRMGRGVGVLVGVGEGDGVGVLVGVGVAVEVGVGVGVLVTVGVGVPHGLTYPGEPAHLLISVVHCPPALGQQYSFPPHIPIRPAFWQTC